jgi:hypothetical protein
VQVTGAARFVDAIIEDTQINTFLERLQWFQDHNPKESWILNELELVDMHGDIIRSIKAGMACTISDGLFKDKSGAAAFTITCPATKVAYTGKHTV